MNAGRQRWCGGGCGAGRGGGGALGCHATLTPNRRMLDSQRATASAFSTPHLGLGPQGCGAGTRHSEPYLPDSGTPSYLDAGQQPRRGGGRGAERGGCCALCCQVPQILHFEPSLDAFTLRSDVISSMKILSPFAVKNSRTPHFRGCVRPNPEIRNSES